MKLRVLGLDIHVERYGSASPALVFVHYWGGTSRTWNRVVDLLEERWTCVVYDVRGWGKSDRTPSRYTTADLADEVLSLVETLNLGDFVLVGHSFGGKIAQLAASRRPPGLKALILVAPAPPTPLVLPPELREFQLHVYDTRESAAQAIPNLFAHTPAADVVEQVIADSTSGTREATLAYPTSSILEDISASVAKINVPTLVVAGELDLVDSVEQHKKEVVDRIPGSRLVAVKDSGHLIPLDSSDALAEEMARFLTQLQL